MINGYPTEEELRHRMERQLGWRGSVGNAVPVWRGYLAALLEWGLIEVPVYDRLESLLPSDGVKETVELLADEPLDKETEAQIDEQIRKSSADKQ